jgi:hypothetical protein
LFLLFQTCQQINQEILIDRNNLLNGQASLSDPSDKDKSDPDPDSPVFKAVEQTTTFSAQALTFN